MALVNITNVIVLDNPTAFSNPFQFEVEFECLGELEDDLEWKVTYVGSAEDSSKDQVLEEVMVGPIPQGVSKFVLQADAPNSALIPAVDLVGVTVVLITCSYREKEFVRIGYYVNNEYYIDAPQPPPENALPESVPQNPTGPRPASDDEIKVILESNQPITIERIVRNILSDQPRVTRFQIDWTPTQQQSQNGWTSGGVPAPHLEKLGGQVHEEDADAMEA